MNACTSCGVFIAETECGGKPACWMCAHMITRHAMLAVGLEAAYVTCACTRDQIFPADVLAKRDAAVRAFGYPHDCTQDGEIISGEVDDRSQEAHASAEVFVILSPAYDAHGQVDEAAPVLEQTFRRVGLHSAELLRVKVRERNRGEKISRAMRAARKSRDAFAEKVAALGGMVHGDGRGKGPNTMHVWSEKDRDIVRVNLDEKPTLTK